MGPRLAVHVGSLTRVGLRRRGCLLRRGFAIVQRGARQISEPGEFELEIDVVESMKTRVARPLNGPVPENGAAGVEKPYLALVFVELSRDRLELPAQVVVLRVGLVRLLLQLDNLGF
jgi:chaperonin GroEL (HSP60 family)